MCTSNYRNKNIFKEKMTFKKVTKGGGGKTCPIKDDFILKTQI